MEYYTELLEVQKIEKDSFLHHKFIPMGLGSILSRLMVGLNLSLFMKRDFSFEIENTYCIEKYFQQLFKKEKGDSKNVYEWNFLKDTWESVSKNLHMYPSCPFEQWKHLTKYQWNILLAHCICGVPTAALEDVKTDFKNRVQWNSFDMHVGVHVRCGDKQIENPFIPESIYYRYLSIIFTEHKDKRIGMYLTSDDEDTYRRMKAELEEFDNVTILWDEKEKRYNNCNGNFVHANPEYIQQETETGCKCISLLGDCEYVVGMSTAQFTWLGGLLSAFKHTFSEEKHLMINPHSYRLDHWASSYSYGEL